MNVEGPADVVIVGPPTQGEDSDRELKDDEDLTEKKIHSQLKYLVKYTYFLKKKKRKKLHFICLRFLCFVSSGFLASAAVGSILSAHLVKSVTTFNPD